METVELAVAQDRYSRYMQVTYLIFSTVFIAFFGAGLICLLAYPWYRNRYIPLFLENLSYSLTEEMLVIRRGVWWKRQSSIPLWKVTDVVIAQGPLQRRYSISVLQIQTAGLGASNLAEGSIVGLANPDSARQVILDRMSQLKGARQ